MTEIGPDHDGQDHIPVPAGHAPRLETIDAAENETVMVRERGSSGTGAWISASYDSLVEARDVQR